MSAPVDHPLAAWQLVEQNETRNFELVEDGKRIAAIHFDHGVDAGRREVLRAAPEMLAMLREMYDSQAIVMGEEADEQRKFRQAGMRRGFDAIGPLLSRIDDARRG